METLRDDRDAERGEQARESRQEMSERKKDSAEI